MAHPPNIRNVSQPRADTDRALARQPLGILIGDQWLCQIQRRQGAGSVRGIGDRWKMQPHNRTGQPKIPLGRPGQRKAAPAIRAIIGDLVAVPYVLRGTSKLRAPTVPAIWHI